MKPRLALGLVLAGLAAGFSAPASAGHDHDRWERRGDRDGRWHGAPARWREEYWDGRCKVERKADRWGNYREERRCPGFGPPGYRGGAPAHWAGRGHGPWSAHPGYGAAPAHRPAPVYGTGPGVAVYPPAVVIQPPPIVIR